MAEPFVLLDAGASGISRLYRAPTEIIRAHSLGEVGPALERIDAGPGEWVGYLAYEAGLALEPALAAPENARAAAGQPLLWFARFARCDRLSDHDVQAWLSAAATAPGRLGPMRPVIDFATYAQAFHAVIEAIRAGDLYQANLTFALSGPWSGCPVAIYSLLRSAAGAGHGALLDDGDRWTLSLSPELFFRKSGRMLAARPMKGTAPRGATPQEDEQLARQLALSGKNRAENLMIVDLLRNDLARVARPGTVRVDRLFAIETYPTLHQMTSAIRAEALEHAKPSDLLTALFPCGSITGAPKIKAMEMLGRLETGARGIYCGSIGRLGSDGDAELNVAIRTLQLDRRSGMARMGVGSGLVADSSLEDEWLECRIKAGFLAACPEVS